MQKLFLFTTVFLGICFSSYGRNALEEINTGKESLLDSSALIDSNNALAFTIYEKLRANKDNFVFSPYNIYSNLALLSQGAAGETLLQFIHFLHFPIGQEKIPGLFFTLNKTLFSFDDSQPLFQYYNNLWLQKGYSLKEPYLKVIKKDFKTVLENVDFLKDQTGAVQLINQTIEKESNGKIVNFFEPGSIDSRTKAAIVSLLFFKGLWQKKFDVSKTTQGSFYTEDKTTVELPMMSGKNTFEFAENAQFSLLEMPYQSSNPEKEFSLFIFLPKDKEGLKEFEDSFSISVFLEAKNTLQPRDVAVLIPKFSEQKQINLTTLLKTIGLRIPFTPFADFSAMTENRDLYINQLFTETTFEIDEEGTEAAAATGGSFTPTSVPLNEVFKADHSFVYLIVEKKTQLILFMGRFIKN